MDTVDDLIISIERLTTTHDRYAPGRGDLSGDEVAEVEPRIGPSTPPTATAASPAQRNIEDTAAGFEDIAVQHRLIAAIEESFGWTGPSGLGRAFAYGTFVDLDLCDRLCAPTKFLDVVMRRSLSYPQLRCFQDGKDIHPDRYLIDSVNRRGQSIRMADMRRISRLIQSGCTLVLDGLESFDPTMEVACRALQWWARELAWVNIYLTTHESSGFGLHWDDHDVIVVQLSGEKKWEVRSRSRNVPMFRDIEPNIKPSDEAVWDGTMKPGDVMHIPRGHWHQATRAGRGNGYSLHATFGFTQRTGTSWLYWLADRCREDEQFRADIDQWSAQNGTRYDDLVTAGTRLMTAYPPSVFVEARRQEMSSARHVSTYGAFGEMTSVVCVTNFEPRVSDHGDTVQVEGAQKRIRFVAKALPAIRLLLSGRPVHLGNACDALGVDIHGLARVLCEEELCAELTTELEQGYRDLVTPVNIGGGA